MSGGIIRVSKTENYAVIHNQMLRDRRLSFGARGMLSYLLSRPDNWTIQVGDLIEQSPAGRDAVYGMMKELETCGYLKRERKQGPGGKIEWEMTVYELPPSPAQPFTEKPYTDKPETVPPYTDKPNHKKERREEVPREEIPTPTTTPRARAPADGIPDPLADEAVKLYVSMMRPEPGLSVHQAALIASEVKPEDMTVWRDVLVIFSGNEHRGRDGTGRSVGSALDRFRKELANKTTEVRHGAVRRGGTGPTQGNRRQGYNERNLAALDELFPDAAGPA